MRRTTRLCRIAILGLALAVAACGPNASDESAQNENRPAADSPATAAPPALHGHLQPGDHAVGFRQETLDLSLPGGVTPTALDVYLWFPAVEPAHSDREAQTVTLADYYRAQETTEPDAAELREWLLADMTSPPGLVAASLEPVLDAPMWARRDLEPATGKHPLALWSYRDSVPTMQAVLNEFLASHGYVVAFAWPVDSAPPLPWQGDLTRADKLRSLEVQIELLEATLDSLVARPWVDGDNTAVLAWSYGGESATGLQRRHSEVRLALGIDAVLAGGWIFQNEDDLAAIDRDQLTATYALLKNGRPRIDGEPGAEPPLLAEVPAGAWYVRFPELSHGNFNFPGGMLPGVLDLAEVSSWAVGGETARLGYELVCRHVLGLLDLHVRGSRAEPSAWSAGAPDGFVEIVRHPPHGELD